MKVLHVIASPRGIESGCLQVSQAFIERLRVQLPDVAVDTIDLYDHSLPSVAGDNIKSRYTLMAGMPIDDRHAQSWRRSKCL